MGKRFHSKIDILEKECTFCGNGPIPLLWREQQTGAALDKLHEARRSTRFEIKNYLSRKIRYIAFLNEHFKTPRINLRLLVTVFPYHINWEIYNFQTMREVCFEYWKD